jgi:hypothetical protein
MNKGAAYWMDLRHFDDEDPIFLAQVQRGITNFVKILTGKDIPVEYATSGDSMTDGETVYIASNIKEDTIDYTVGLALHEASHVLLTDFDYLNKEKGKVLERHFNIPKEDVNNVFTLVNFIEDKRIDDYVYRNAPGYQYYYEELYSKSFYNKLVDDSLLDAVFIKPTWDAYFFRIINIFNRNSDLDALPGLKEVCDLIDIKNINRLESTQDSVKVAVGIYDIIKEYLIEDDEDEGESNLNKNQEDRVQDQVDKQKNFIDSNYRKKRVHKKIKEHINKIANSDTKLKTCKVDTNTFVPIVITNEWEEYFKSPMCHHDKTIKRGIQLGKGLLSRLKNRNTIKQDIFENLKKGKLNRQKIYSAPFNENIFYRVEKENFKDTFIHISLDLSGSMQGSKLEKTLQTAVAIAYTACHLKNFDVEISVRGTTDERKTQPRPLLAYVFNSKKHSLKELYKLAYLRTNGMTPEGVCLHEIRKSLPKPSYYQDVFLLNISDGLPNINNSQYNFSTAVNHTAKVIRNYKKEGIGVLSYFISSNEDKAWKADKTFEKMYGRNAKYINLDNISLVANTINNLLLNNTIKVS